MNWKEELSKIESNFGYHKKMDWKPAVKLVKNFIEKYPNDMEVYIRVIYLIHNILVEEDYPDDAHDEMADLLKNYFEKSYILFSENTEYLFFIGKILYIAEWYFGLDDDSKPMTDRLACKMQKKAMDEEPGNILYEWAYRLSVSDDVVGYYLANQLIEHEKEKVDWLKSKYFPGNYILEHLRICNHKYLVHKNLPFHSNLHLLCRKNK